MHQPSPFLLVPSNEQSRLQVNVKEMKPLLVAGNDTSGHIYVLGRRLYEDIQLLL